MRYVNSALLVLTIMLAILAFGFAAEQQAGYPSQADIEEDLRGRGARITYSWQVRALLEALSAHRLPARAYAFLFKKGPVLTAEFMLGGPAAAGASLSKEALLSTTKDLLSHPEKLSMEVANSLWNEGLRQYRENYKLYKKWRKEGSLTPTEMQTMVANADGTGKILLGKELFSDTLSYKYDKSKWEGASKALLTKTAELSEVSDLFNTAMFAGELAGILAEAQDALLEYPPWEKHLKRTGELIANGQLKEPVGLGGGLSNKPATAAVKGRNPHPQKGKRQSIHDAAAAGLIDSVKMLLEYGANVNARDEHGGTPLYEAVRKSRTEAVRYLLEMGADPTIPRGRQTPLHAAALKRNLEIVSFLLEAGAVASVPDENRDTPLHIAASRALKDNVWLLLAHGANLNARNRDGDTPLHAAIKSKKAIETKDPSVARFLIYKGSDLKIKGKNNATPVFSAVYRWTLQTGDRSLALSLISKDVALSEPNKDGNTPLHLAAVVGLTQIVKALLSKNTDINHRNSRGQTPLLLSLASDKQDIAKALISNGADITLADSGGLTPLHLAFNEESLLLAELILANGGSVAAKDGYGRSPLHHAIRALSTDGVQLLLKHHANPNAQDMWGGTALHAVASVCKSHFPTLLGSRKRPHEQAVYRILRNLMESGADINAVDNDGKTALHRTVSGSSGNAYRLADALLSSGADVNTQDNRGNTCLHELTTGSIYKAKGGDWGRIEWARMLDVLARNGARFDIKNKKGRTPLDVRDKSIRRRFQSAKTKYANAVPH